MRDKVIENKKRESKREESDGKERQGEDDRGGEDQLQRGEEAAQIFVLLSHHYDHIFITCHVTFSQHCIVTDTWRYKTTHMFRMREAKLAVYILWSTHIDNAAWSDREQQYTLASTSCSSPSSWNVG